MAGRRKGREKRATQTEPEDDGSGLVPMELDEQGVKERSEELVSWCVKHHQMVDKKKEQVAKINAEIKIARDRIRVLTRECDERVAYVDPQMAMPFGGGVGSSSNDAAVQAS